MYWSDEGYLLSKNNFDENSIIIETFTLEHGKYTGMVYGGTSRKKKKILQIGNKIFLNWNSKNENKVGYFNIELINPISPLFFDDKKRTTCILAATSILKILLPSRQINKNIYYSFEKILNDLNHDNWINLYILWELLLIKQLGFETNFTTDETFSENEKLLNTPKLILDNNNKNVSNKEISEALKFNKNLLMKNFITPNKLKFPIFRNILEKYYI